MSRTMKVRVATTVEVNPEWLRYRFGGGSEAELRRVLKAYLEAELASIIDGWRDDYLNSNNSPGPGGDAGAEVCPKEASCS